MPISDGTLRRLAPFIDSMPDDTPASDDSWTDAPKHLPSDDGYYIVNEAGWWGPMDSDQLRDTVDPGEAEYVFLYDSVEDVALNVGPLEHIVEQLIAHPGSLASFHAVTEDFQPLLPLMVHLQQTMFIDRSAS